MYSFLRFLWYLISRVLIWAAAVGLVLLAFFLAMDYMNTSTLIKDGMHLRAQVVIEGADPSALGKVFSKVFLENDTLLKSSAYRQYKVSDFDYNADCVFTLIFPWQDNVTLRMTEEVSNIQAQVTPDPDSGIPGNPPVWNDAIYDIKLTRTEGSWRIISITTVQTLPANSHSPSVSPIEAS